MEDSRIPSQWELRGYKRKIGWTSSDETWRTWTSPGMKPKNWRQTEQNGVNMWLNAPIWMRDGLRSKVSSVSFKALPSGFEFCPSLCSVYIVINISVSTWRTEGVCSTVLSFMIHLPWQSQITIAWPLLVEEILPSTLFPPSLPLISPSVPLRSTLQKYI